MGIAYQQTFVARLVSALQLEARGPQFDPSQAHYYFEELVDLRCLRLGLRRSRKESVCANSSWFLKSSNRILGQICG